MTTEDKSAGQRMPARPSDEEGVGKAFIGIFAVLAIFLSARSFYLLGVELDAYYPDNGRAFLQAILGLGCFIGAVSCLYKIGSQAAWRNYADQAESQFAQLQKAHLALLDETAEYRRADAAATEKLDARQQAEREAMKAGVVTDVVAYQHGAVTDDQPDEPYDAKNL